MADTQTNPTASEATRHTPGTFCWWDLSTTDQEGAKKFYTQLLGWSPVDIPVGESMVYTMLQVDGKDAAAMSTLPKELLAQGVPPHWNSYIAVEDVDAVTEKAKSLGAQVAMEPMDVMEEGRMAMIQDPTGAMVALWQSKRHGGAAHVGDVGGVCWNELYTRDPKGAGEFYSNLLGWKPVDSGMPGMNYTMFQKGEQTIGGMLEMDEKFENVPPHWMPYFSVEDADASVAKAKELGGTVVVPPMDIPQVGRFAVLTDPQGGHFSIIKLAQG